MGESDCIKLSDFVHIRGTRDLLRKAILQGKEEHEARVEAGRLAKERKSREEQQRAHQVIDNLPTICKDAAARGESSAEAMILEWEDVSDRRVANPCDPEELTGVSRIVFEACRILELKPELKFWHDGEGKFSGFHIIVHW
jgi:hypothetical protein